MSRVLRFTRPSSRPSCEDAQEEYLLWKRAQGLREVTLKGHRDVLRCFFNRHPLAWDSGNLEREVLAFMGERIKPATYNIRRNYLRQFFAWATSRGYVDGNPFDDLSKRFDPGREVDIDQGTLKKLLSLPRKNTFSGLRDLCVLLVQIDTGARPAEIFGLTPPDLDRARMSLLIRPEVSKTGRGRSLPLSPVTVQTIERFVSYRPSEWQDHAPLFPSERGTPMTRFTWGERLQRYSALLGVKIRPYDLRHTFAVSFLRAGGHVFSLMKIMGHTSMNTTRRYIALSSADLREQHAKASPLAAIMPAAHRVRSLKNRPTGA